MTSTSKRLLVAVLAVVLTLSVATLGITAFAVTTTDTIEYPFAKGDNAFKYAPTWQGATTSENYWQFFQINIKELALDDFDYIGMQVSVTGNPGLTVGGISGGARFDTGENADGHKLYFVTEDGTVSELSVQFGSINLGLNAKGMLLLPKNQLVWRWGTDTKINKLYFTTNALYNRDFTLTIGEVGYFKGEPAKANLVKLVDLSAGCSESNYYVDNAVKTPVVYPVYKADAYPFRVGEEAFANAPTWKGQSAKTETASYQFFQPQFAVTDLTKATYLAVQLKVVKGNFGFTFGAISQGNGRYGTYVDKTAGAKLVTNDGKSTDLEIKYQSITLTQGTEGMLLVPMANLSWVGWAEEAAKTMDKMASIFFETNAQYNFGFEMTVGDVGYYVGEPGQNGSIYTSLMDLSAGEKKDMPYLGKKQIQKVQTYDLEQFYATLSRTPRGLYKQGVMFLIHHSDK